jgi:hypothetical protein
MMDHGLSSHNSVGRWPINQFAEIVDHQMRAMVPKLCGIPLARNADHKPEASV